MTQPVVRDLQSLPGTPHVVTIGSFDGVHRGHQYLLKSVSEEARERQVESLVVTFDPLPAEVLRPDKAPPRLSTTDERTREILNCGIDRVVVLTFTPETANQSAGDFLATLVRYANPKLILIGEDFAFGHNREGTPEFLRQRASVDGFDLKVIERHNPDDAEWASSFVRRQLMESGDVDKARLALGRYFELAGRVQNGDHRGRDLGYPTANLAIPEGLVIPADGIYAALVSLENGLESEPKPALVYVGTRPTFGEHDRIVEAFLLNFDSDLYNQRISIQFVDRIRGDRRFDSANELVQQMKQDEQAGRRLLANHGIHVASPDAR